MGGQQIYIRVSIENLEVEDEVLYVKQIAPYLEEVRAAVRPPWVYS